MLGKPFLLQVEIRLVDLVACKVQPRVLGGDPARPAPQVCVQDLVPRFCVMLIYPSIKRNGFLCRVYALFLILHILLEHAVPFERKHPALPLQICPRDLAIGLIHSPAAFVPHNHAGCRVQVVEKKVPAPNYPPLTDPLKLPEVLRVRWGAVIEHGVKFRFDRSLLLFPHTIVFAPEWF